MRLIFFCTILFFSQAQAKQFNLFEENGKVGLKNDNGIVLIPAQHDALGWPEQEFYIQNKVLGYKTGEAWGLISIENKIITPPQYTSLRHVSGTYILASLKAPQSFRIKQGCIDIYGKTIIPFEYDGITIQSLRAIVYNRIQNKVQFGVIDLDNKILIPLQYRSVAALGNLRFAVENEEAKIALFSDQGKQLTNFSIDKISAFKKNYAILYEGEKQGLIDRNGTIHLGPTYQEIRIDEEGNIFTKQRNQWKILDANNQLLNTLEFDSIEILSVNRYGLRNGETVKLVDGDFTPLSETSFTTINPFIENETIFTQGLFYGLLRMDGTIALPAHYNALIQNHQDLLSMKVENGMTQWSLVNTLGEIKSQKFYDRILPFNGLFYPVKKRGYWGAIDTAGKEIITCVFDSLLQVADPFVVVKFHNQYGVIDVQENWHVTPQHEIPQVIHADRYLLKVGSTTYLKSFSGGLIYFTDNTIYPTSDFLEETISDGSLWKIDFDGRIIHRQLPPDSPFEEILPASEGLRAIKKNGRYGFIDDRGRLRIANRYENVQPFSENLAAIQILNRWGFINHQEQLVIQPVYENVTSFERGISIVQLKSKVGIIDITGRILLTPQYDQLQPLPSGRLLVKQNEFYGLVDKNGNLTIQTKFDSLEDLDNGFVIIKKDGKYGLMTLQGVSTIPLIYDQLTFDAINNRYFALQKTEWQKAD